MIAKFYIGNDVTTIVFKFDFVLFKLLEDKVFGSL